MTDNAKVIFPVMPKIYDLVTVLESSTVASPHFVKARAMILEELEILSENVEEPALRDSVINVRQSWRKLESSGMLENYVTAIKDLKIMLKKLS